MSKKIHVLHLGLNQRKMGLEANTLPEDHRQNLI
jgi:hypothetical protein